MPEPELMLIYNIAQKQALVAGENLFVYGSREIDENGSWFAFQKTAAGLKLFNPKLTRWLKGGDDNLTRNGDPILVSFGNSESPGETFRIVPRLERNDSVVTVLIVRDDNFQALFVSDDLEGGRNLAESHRADFDERDMFALLRNAFDEFLRGEPVMLFNIAMGEALFISNDRTRSAQDVIVEGRSVESDRIDQFVLRPGAAPGTFRIHNPRSVLDLGISSDAIGGDQAVVGLRGGSDWTVERVPDTEGTFVLRSGDHTMFLSGDRQGFHPPDHVVEAKKEREARSEFLAVRFAALP